MKPDNNINGKVCLITGATAGIGKVTAKELARMGATVVMLCRNRAKGEAVKEEIEKTYRNARVDLIQADLCSLDDVRRAADEFRSKYSKLDVLVNNAGGVNHERKLTVDNLEATFEANYLSHFLLTILLLDVLKKSAPSRIINVSSMAHIQGRISFKDLQAARKYGWMSSYAQSKLAQIYFTYELADRLAGSGVTVNALHPGLVSSNFNNNTKGIVHVISGLVYGIAGVSVEEGAQTTIYLATSPDVGGVSGKYFDKCKEKESSRLSRDRDVGRQLWEVSEEVIKEKIGIEISH